MQFLLEQCHITVQQHQSVLLTLFLAGLVGGVTHCAGMCGPFVTAQVGHQINHGAQPEEFARLKGASLLPYHFGRMTTYIILGVIAALLSRQIIGTAVQHWASVIFLSLAGAIFIASALPHAKRLLNGLRLRGVSRFGEILGRLAKPLFSSPTGIQGYGLGLLLGLLPCGLVFAALMVVSATANPYTAAVAMALFTLGTFPSLFLVGLGSQFACRRWPVSMQWLTRGVMVLNGFSLFILAGTMV